MADTERQIADQMGEPKRTATEPLAARAAAARSLFTKAELVVDEKDAACWLVSRGGDGAPLWLFWPATGAFRTERGEIAGYGASKLVAAIKSGER